MGIIALNRMNSTGQLTPCRPEIEQQSNLIWKSKIWMKHPPQTMEDVIRIMEVLVGDSGDVAVETIQQALNQNYDNEVILNYEAAGIFMDMLNQGERITTVKPEALAAMVSKLIFGEETLIGDDQASAKTRSESQKKISRADTLVPDLTTGSPPKRMHELLPGDIRFMNAHDFTDCRICQGIKIYTIQNSSD